MKINQNTLTVPFEKFETVSFTSSIMKNIAEDSALSRFPVKLICWIAFGSTSSFVYLNLLQLICSNFLNRNIDYT